MFGEYDDLSVIYHHIGGDLMGDKLCDRCNDISTTLAVAVTTSGNSFVRALAKRHYGKQL